MSPHPLRLRPFERDDFPHLLKWVDSPEFLLQWAGRNFRWPLSVEQLESYLAEAECAPPLRRLFSALDPAGNVIGHIGLRDLDSRDLSATVSCVLIGESAKRGGGLGTAMMEAISRIGFEDHGLHRLELYVFDFNRRAIECYERAGFQIEGLLRDKRRIGDAWWSPFVMSLLRADWEKRHRGSGG